MRWRGGFDLKYWHEHLACPVKIEKKIGTSQAWKQLRELCHPTWAKAFREAIFNETGENSFTYIIAVITI
jgi:hypothetical protein